MTRQSTGKRLRFEIMKRDGFRCRYCGATAATTLLHVDHVVPVADGGPTEAANLVTACASCNGGKSNVPIDESLLSEPESMGAIAEHAEQMRAYLDAVKEREDAFNELAQYVEGVWRARVADLHEDTAVALRSAIAKVGLEKVVEAITAVSRSRASGSHNRLLYFQGVIRKMRLAGGEDV